MDGLTARDEADLLGKEGLEGPVEALNFILRAMGNHQKVLSGRVACSNFGFRKFPLAAGRGGSIQSTAAV